MNRFLACIALTLGLVLPVNTQAAQFKFATQTLTVPDGFEIELVAQPPMVDRPISLAPTISGPTIVKCSSHR